MKVKLDGIEKHFRTVWMKGSTVCMIDQRLLPHRFKLLKCRNYLDTVEAIKNMTVRGAGAIGATAGYAMCQAALESANLRKPLKYLFMAADKIKASRPTAQNLFYAVDRVCNAINNEETLESAVKAAVLGSKRNC